MDYKGYNNSTLKQQNRGMILKLLAMGKCSSRIDIARETGLSKMAASNIINEFIDEGILEESDKRKIKGKGRNPITLQLSSKAPKIIGVHITRKRCGACFCNLKLETIDSASFEITEDNHDDLMENIFKLVDSLIKAHPDERVLGIGIGALGPVDSGRGRILNPPNFYNMHDIDVLDMFKERYDIPVFFEHEYDCAALTELYFGSGRDLSNFLFIGIAWGVGAGAVSKGTLYRSEAGFGTEFGHICIDYNGPVCQCGRRGCVETYTSTLRIAEELKRVTGEDLSYQEFCKLYENDAPEEVDRVFRDAACKLAIGITNVVNLTNTEFYIIGHGGVIIPDRYIEYCEHKVNERMVFREHRKVRIMKSERHSEVLSESCACAVLDRVFRGVKEEIFT